MKTTKNKLDVLSFIQKEGRASRSKERKLKSYYFAKDCVDTWDMDTLINFAVGRLEEDWNKMEDKEFNQQYNDFYGE